MNFYTAGRHLTSLLFRISGTKILGKENIPEEKSVLIIANHVSFADPPALSYAYPYPITYIAKEAFAKRAATRILFGALGAVFLKEGESDLSALRYAINELKNDRAVAIFPEGQRNFDQIIGEFKGGASYIADRTGAIVLPMSVLNTGNYVKFWKRNIVINIGEPIRFDNMKRLSKEELEHHNKIFENAVKKLFHESKEFLAKKGKKC